MSAEKTTVFIDSEEVFACFRQSLDGDLNSILYDNEYLNGKLVEFHSSLRNSIIDQIKELAVRNGDDLAAGSCTTDRVLQRVWDVCQLPVFNWFSQWKDELFQNNNDCDKSMRRPTTVEWRILNNKCTKAFKIFHRFYYKIIEYIACNYDTSYILPIKLINDLNLDYIIEKWSHQEKFQAKQQKLILQPHSSHTVAITMIFYNCLLHLGKVHSFKKIIETHPLLSRQKQELGPPDYDFGKAIKYLHLATVLFPALGNTYYELSRLDYKRNNIDSQIFYLVRATYARIANNTAENELIELFQYDNLLNILMLDDDINHDIAYSDIPRCYTLLIISQFINRILGKKIKNISLHKNKIEKLLFDHIKDNEFQEEEINCAFQNIVIIMGMFHLILDKSKHSSVEVQIHLEAYLNFTFDFFSIIINKIKCYNISELLNDNNFKILAIPRIIMCWIKSNKILLQFTHKHESICESFVQFTNKIYQHSRSQVLENIFSSKRPQRSYFFQEDIFFKEFSCINYLLTDFNDSALFNKNNIINRLTGYPPKMDRLVTVEENQLKLEAIITSTTRFLKQNKCGYKWNSILGRYIRATNNGIDHNKVPEDRIFGMAASKNKITKIPIDKENNTSIKRNILVSTTEALELSLSSAISINNQIPHISAVSMTQRPECIVISDQSDIVTMNNHESERKIQPKLNSQLNPEFPISIITSSSFTDEVPSIPFAQQVEIDGPPATSTQLPQVKLPLQ